MKKDIRGLLWVLLLCAVSLAGAMGFLAESATAGVRGVAGSTGGGSVPSSTCSTQGGVIYNNALSFTCDSNFTYATSGPTVTVGSGTTTSAGLQLSYSGISGFGGIYATGITPSNSNFSFITNGSQTFLNASSGVFIRRNNTDVVNFNGAGMFPAGDTVQSLGSATLRFSEVDAISVGSTGAGVQNVYESGTVTAIGTTGAQTINKLVGTINVASGTASVVLTNNKLNGTATPVMAMQQTNDATCVLKNVVVSTTTATFTMSANCTGTTALLWEVKQVSP